MTDEEKAFYDYVEAVAHECADILIENKLVKRPKLFKRFLIIQIKNSRSRGGVNTKGKPRISICKWYMNPSEPFDEYPRISKDNEIGSFKSDNPEHHVQAIVAHEIAHAADYWDGDNSMHGAEWRFRYRALRRALGLVFNN